MTVADEFRFDGRAVLVTGGSRGIGAAVARRFAGLGADVAIACRAPGAESAAVLEDLRTAGAKAHAFAADMGDPEAPGALVAAVCDAFGRLDVVVNAAAIAPYVPLDRIDAAHIRAVFDANVTGAILLTRAAAERITAPGGRIIHFSSRLATDPLPESSVYAASKAAVNCLVAAYARTLGPRGITVNAVAPGVIETPMTADILRQRGAAIIARTPLGRIGQPADVAGAVTFIASPAAGWMTGKTLVLDGGVS